MNDILLHTCHSHGAHYSRICFILITKAVSITWYMLVGLQRMTALLC